MEKILGIIPARKESRRLKRKNTKLLGGKPLFQWAAQNLIAVCDKVVVTTDDEEIKELCKTLGLKVDVLDRPPELATDTATSLDVALHAVEQYPEFNTIIFSEPTHPLIEIEDIERMLRYFKNDSLPGIASVSKFTMKFVGTTLIVSRNILFEEKSLFPKGMGIYLVAGKKCVDIDEWYDFAICEALLHSRVYE